MSLRKTKMPNIFLILVALGLLAFGWLSRPASKSRRIEFSVFGVWALGIVVILQIFGEDVTPLTVFSVFAVVVWFLSILWLPPGSVIPAKSMRPLKELLLGLAFSPIVLIVVWIVDRHQIGGFLIFTVFIMLQNLRTFLVRVRTESKTLSPVEQ